MMMNVKYYLKGMRAMIRSLYTAVSGLISLENRQNNIKSSKISDDNKINIKSLKKEDSDNSFQKDYPINNFNEDVISEINFSNNLSISNDNLKSNKLEKVKLLLENGLTDDKICEELSIGKGEVLLVKSLLKN